MQAVIDYKIVLRHIVVGWPGSVHDARIFQESKLATNPEEFFSGEEYLAAGCAYTLTARVMTPFRSNSSTLTPAQIKENNSINTSAASEFASNNYLKY